jgi:hypothetical protein
MEQAGYPVKTLEGRFFQDLFSGRSYGDQTDEGVAKMGETYMFRVAEDKPALHFPKKNPRTARFHEREVTAGKIFSGWANKHLSHPFPTATEKSSLMEETGLDKEQLEDWFKKYRQKRKKAAQKSDSGPKQMKLGFEKVK